MAKTTVEFIEVGSRVFYISKNSKICTGKVTAVDIKSQTSNKVRVEYFIREDDNYESHVNRTSKGIGTTKEKLIDKL